jgi:hypothetical protein
MFSRSYYAATYFPLRFFAPAEHFGWFPHNYFAETYYTSWYYCPASLAGSKTYGLSIIEKPHVSLIPTRYVDWWVLCKPAVSWTATNFHRIRWEVLESPFVEFIPSVVALHGEFEIVERPFVEFVTTIGKSQECISADGSAGNAPVINAVY